ncbi:hypothetical protein DSUL_40045 [Desulfovibrionales bacterium]
MKARELDLFFYDIAAGYNNVAAIF